MESILKKEICKLLGISSASYYRWKEERPIITLLEKYFSDQDLEEFLETGKISKLESKNLDDDFKHIILDDHMLHSAAYKLDSLSAGTFKMLEILRDALGDIDPKDESFTLDNSKQRLIDRIYAVEKNSIFKTKAKKEGVAHWIEKFLSKAEVYAMVKHPDTIVSLLQ
jgi:hypothetical protein